MSGPRICKFKVTVEKISGKCNANYVQGQEFIFNGMGTPENFCGGAYHVMFPAIFAMKFGAVFPFEKEPGVAHSTCPDNGYVTFKIKRMEEHEGAQ